MHVPQNDCMHDIDAAAASQSLLRGGAKFDTACNLYTWDTVSCFNF